MIELAPNLIEAVERKGLYAGSFDPPTNGHQWIIEKGSELFDELVVVVGVNPSKKYMFSTEERLEMLSEISKPFPNVTIDQLDSRLMTARYAAGIGCKFLLRGLRDPQDFGEEQKLSSINRDAASTITTVHMIGPDELLKISSSTVKGIVGLEGWQDLVELYVPDFVMGAMRNKFEEPATD
jgi:pantetheine-phosphate adenylyltransferase